MRRRQGRVCCKGRVGRQEWHREWHQHRVKRAAQATRKWCQRACSEGPPARPGPCKSSVEPTLTHSLRVTWWCKLRLLLLLLLRLLLLGLLLLGV